MVGWLWEQGLLLTRIRPEGCSFSEKILAHIYTNFEENQETLGRLDHQAPPRIEPGTSFLPV